MNAAGKVHLILAIVKAHLKACGHRPIARLLLDRGADPNLKARIGHCPLHNAARNGHIEVARLLLDRGADINLRDDNHKNSPTGWASFQGQKEMEQLLRERGGVGNDEA